MAAWTIEDENGAPQNTTISGGNLNVTQQSGIDVYIEYVWQTLPQTQGICCYRASISFGHVDPIFPTECSINLFVADGSGYPINAIHTFDSGIIPAANTTFNYDLCGIDLSDIADPNFIVTGKQIGRAHV